MAKRILTLEREIRPLFEGVDSGLTGQCSSAKPWFSLRCLGLQGLAFVLGSGLLGGCASPGRSGDGLLDQALGVVGLQRASAAAAAQDAARDKAAAAVMVTRRVKLRVHAGLVLNVGETGSSLPVVLRLYKLKNREAFEQLPYAAFARMPSAGIDNFSSDIVETREMVLLPGQRHEVVEILEPHVQFIAVVALFRSPAPQRWRAIFEAQSAATSSITLGLHGCAVSVATGQALDMQPELMRVAGVRCDGG